MNTQNHRAFPLSSLAEINAIDVYGRNRQRVVFSDQEFQALVTGMILHGTSWCRIRAEFREYFHPSRTDLDLKDKARTESRKRISLFGCNNLDLLGIFCLMQTPINVNMEQVVNTPLWHYSRSHIFPVQQRAGRWGTSPWNVYPQFSGNPQDPPASSDATRLYNSTLVEARLGRDVQFEQLGNPVAAAAGPVPVPVPDPDDEEGQTHRRNWGRARKPSDFGIGNTTAGSNQSSSQGLVGSEDDLADGLGQQQSQQQDHTDEQQGRAMEVDESSSGESTFQSSNDSSDLPGFDELLQEQRLLQQAEARAAEDLQPSASSLLVEQTPQRPQIQASPADNTAPVQQTLQSLAVDSDEESERESVKLRREEQRVLRLAQRRADDQIVFIRHSTAESKMAWGFGGLCRVDVGRFEYAPFFVLVTAIQHNVVDVMDCCKNLNFPASSLAAAKSHVLSQLSLYMAGLMYRVEHQGRSMVVAGMADPVADLYSGQSSYKSMLKGKSPMQTGSSGRRNLHEEITRQNELYTAKSKALLAQPGVILNRAILEQVLEYNSLMPIRDHIGNLIFESSDDDEE